jgi:hypothetical protein
MTADDAATVLAVYRYFGINGDISYFFNVEVDHNRALKNYRLIYASLTYEERRELQ